MHHPRGQETRVRGLAERIDGNSVVDVQSGCVANFLQLVTLSVEISLIAG